MRVSILLFFLFISINVFPLKFSHEVEYYAWKAALKYDISVYLIKSIIEAESSGRKYLKSHVGARGYMQLMPETYKDMGYNAKRQPVYEAKYNIFAGTKYLKFLIRLFKGNLKLAIASYNCGPYKIIKIGKKKKVTLKQWKDMPDISKRYFYKVFGHYVVGVVDDLKLLLRLISLKNFLNLRIGV